MIVLEKRRQMIEARRGEIAFVLDLLGPGDDPDFAEVPVAEPAPVGTGLKESFEQLLPNIAARVLAETQPHHRKPRRDVHCR
jgi:hypothetical protein